MEDFSDLSESDTEYTSDETWSPLAEDEAAAIAEAEQDNIFQELSDLQENHSNKYGAISR